MNIVVNSYGGCGSKFLTKQIVKQYQNIHTSSIHQHIRNPSDIKDVDNLKMIFVIGDPIDAILSFFWRQKQNTSQHGFNNKASNGSLDWPARHCKNIAGDYLSLNPTWTLSKYLENSVDLFLLREFLENWLNHELKEKVLFIKYENIWEHKKDIANFLCLGDEFVTDFSEKVARTSKGLVLPKEDKSRLENVYGDFANFVNSLDNCFYK